VATLLVVPSQDRIQKYAKVHAIVGTPGKVMDMAKKRVIDVSSIKVFVLDEADMMLDQENNMGPQVTQIRALMQNDVQVLFFSATYPDDVRAFAENLVPRAVSIKVRKTELTLASVAQMYMRCEDEWDKFNKLTALYGAMNVGQSVIFVNQRKKAFQLAKWMRDAGFAVSLICGTQTSGDERMDPALRDHVMDEFRNCVTRVLIATDVLSRGIDVPQVTLVVNYELPINWTDRGVDMETYLHRVGRTGRFGLRGLAVNLLTDRERPMLIRFVHSLLARLSKWMKTSRHWRSG
jgi:ATP-dependent RNA helicase DDX19/DBP5